MGGIQTRAERVRWYEGRSGGAWMSGWWRRRDGRDRASSKCDRLIVIGEDADGDENRVDQNGRTRAGCTYDQTRSVQAPILFLAHVSRLLAPSRHRRLQ